MFSLLGLAIALWVVAIKKAGAHIHKGALHTLIQAPLRFFTNTDTGTITNLFSQDLNLIDTELPEATLNTLACVSASFGIDYGMPVFCRYQYFSSQASFSVLKYAS